jgi:hypothetical protein
MIDYLTNFIMNRIKLPLLELLVTNRLETLKSQIAKTIVIDVVLNDLNMVGGRGMEATIESGWIISNDIEKGEMIIEVPEDKRNNSFITTASLIYTDHNNIVEVEQYNLGNNISPDNGISLFSGIENKNSNISLHTELEVIGNKYILIRKKGSSPTMLVNSVLRFEVAYGANMEGIDRAYYPELGRVCVLATKFILNNKTLEVEELMAHNPTMSSLILRELEKFEGFDILYDEEINLLAKISHLNNDNRETEHINIGI